MVCRLSAWGHQLSHIKLLCNMAELPFVLSPDRLLLGMTTDWILINIGYTVSYLNHFQI